MRILITGISGCIGAATATHLLKNGVERVVGVSRRNDLSRICESLRDQVVGITCDITDATEVNQAIAEYEPSHIIHLAAVQTPDCQANPLVGMDVNVLGTVHLFRAASQLKESLQRFVFASSCGVYGPRTMYPQTTVAEDVPFFPPNLYGFWKVAGEGAAQAFHSETGVPTVSLRPATTYGPGRDQGMTSAATTALKAVSLDAPFAMPYDGREHYSFVDDVGAAFAHAAIDAFSGYGVFNVPGVTCPVPDYLKMIQEVAEEMGITHRTDLTIAADAVDFPFICDLDQTAIVNAFPNTPRTSLRRGIEKSLQRFQQLAAKGQLAI